MKYNIRESEVDEIKRTEYENKRSGSEGSSPFSCLIEKHPDLLKAWRREGYWWLPRGGEVLRVLE